MDKLFKDSDLEDLFSELNAEIEKREQEHGCVEDEETIASQKRYDEIIKRRKEG